MTESCESSCKQVTRTALPLTRLYSSLSNIPLHVHLISSCYFIIFSRFVTHTLSSFHTRSLIRHSFLSKMLPQQYLRPYTSTLSMLRKIDLLRLCVELKLPNDGTVLNLRDRLPVRVYLNAHRDTLYRNPRYRPLYPQHRRLTWSTAPRGQVEEEPVNCSPSPAARDWHG